MKTSAFEELLEYVQSIELLRQVIDEDGRAGIPDIIKGLHKAALESLTKESEFEDEDSAQSDVERAFRGLLGTAAAIYAIAANWSERDEHGYNPALSALLDEIGYEGDRYLAREYRL